MDRAQLAALAKRAEADRQDGIGQVDRLHRLQIRARVRCQRHDGLALQLVGDHEIGDRRFALLDARLSLVKDHVTPYRARLIGPRALLGGARRLQGSGFLERFAPQADTLLRGKDLFARGGSVAQSHRRETSEAYVELADVDGSRRRAIDVIHRRFRGILKKYAQIHLIRKGHGKAVSLYQLEHGVTRFQG